MTLDRAAGGISICIVSYRAPDLLRKCLKSVHAAEQGIPIEVILVDNAADPDWPAAIRQEFPGVILLPSEGNVGFARAMNRAIKAAIGPYVLILNPDTELAEDALVRPLGLLREQPSYGAVGPRLVRPDGSTDWASRRMFPLPRDLFFRMVFLDRLRPRSKVLALYARSHVPYEVSGPTGCLSGAFMLIRREAIESVGAFDERFFMYGEDLDLSQRLTERGWVLYYDSQTIVLHLKHGTARLRPIRMRFEYYRSLWMLYRKHYGNAWLSERILFALVVLAVGTLAVAKATVGQVCRVIW